MARIYEIVTGEQLHERLAETIEAVNHNIKNVDTCNRRDQRRVTEAVERRIKEIELEQRALDLADAASVLNAERMNRRLLTIERRVRELEAKTLAARWRAFCMWCRMFVAELGGPFVYDDESVGRPRRVWQFLGGRWNEMHLDDEPLDPALTDELIEMYRPPASLPLVRQDARNGRSQ